jgi:hypothetical protein
MDISLFAMHNLETALFLFPYARIFAILDSGDIILVLETALLVDILCRFVVDVTTPYILRPQSTSHEDGTIDEEVCEKPNCNCESTIAINHVNFVGEYHVYNSEKWKENLTQKGSQALGCLYEVFMVH